MASRVPSGPRVAGEPRPGRTPEQEQATYQAKGSARPIKGKCGARLPKRYLGPLREVTPWRYCTEKPMRGRRKCKLHGGPSRAGLDHPNYKNGKRTNPFAIGSALARGYDALQHDDDYLTVKEQQRLLRARQEQLVDRIAAGSGESATAWARVRGLAAKLRDALLVNPPTPESLAALVDASRELVTVAQGSEREEAFVELREIAGIWGRLSETEARLLERNHAVLGVNEYLAMAQAIGGLAAQYISDRVAMREFLAGMRAMLGSAAPPAPARRQLAAGATVT